MDYARNGTEFCRIRTKNILVCVLLYPLFHYVWWRVVGLSSLFFSLVKFIIKCIWDASSFVLLFYYLIEHSIETSIKKFTELKNWIKLEVS